jgi:uncharacterized protein (DUF433 family)
MTTTTPAAKESYIRKRPGICGGDACIRDTRITVWGLALWRKLGLSDAEIRERVPDVSPNDLQAAWTYYAQHPQEIERSIAENEDA